MSDTLLPLTPANLARLETAALELVACRLHFEAVRHELVRTQGDELHASGADSLDVEVSRVLRELASMDRWLTRAIQAQGGDPDRPTDAQRADRMAQEYDNPLLDPSDHPRPRGAGDEPDYTRDRDWPRGEP